MKWKKELRFFADWIESYANYKRTSAGKDLKQLDEKNLTDFVYNMYEWYHIEAIENAYKDIDNLIETGQPAW